MSIGNQFLILISFLLSAVIATIVYTFFKMLNIKKGKIFKDIFNQSLDFLSVILVGSIFYINQYIFYNGEFNIFFLLIFLLSFFFSQKYFNKILANFFSVLYNGLVKLLKRKRVRNDRKKRQNIKDGDKSGVHNSAGGDADVSIHPILQNRREREKS